MSKPPKVSVILETDSGRNKAFLDNSTGNKMPRSEFVKKIKDGVYPDYYVRTQNGVPTPVSKPNGIKTDNLG